jgi:hypothetical protein
MKICLEFLSFFTTGGKVQAGFVVFADIKFPQMRCLWMTYCQDPRVSVEVQILCERVTTLRYSTLLMFLLQVDIIFPNFSSICMSAEFYTHAYFKH